MLLWLMDRLMPRSYGYGDATVMYIRCAKIPSYMYAKHQYMQKIRVQKHSGNIYSNKIVQIHSYHRVWSNIIWILHHHKAQSMIYKVIYKVQKLIDAHEQ